MTEFLVDILIAVIVGFAASTETHNYFIAVAVALGLGNVLNSLRLIRLAIEKGLKK